MTKKRPVLFYLILKSEIILDNLILYLSQQFCLYYKKRVNI